MSGNAGSQFTDLPGIRPGVLWRLALAGIPRQPVRSAITLAVITLATVAVVSSSGRTQAARHTLLAALETPAARVIRIIDTDGSAHLRPDQVEAISQLDAVDWVVGLSAAGPIGRNPGLGDATRGFASEAVGTRRYWGSLISHSLVTLTNGRQPDIGEAVVGSDAASDLHLGDGLGTVDDELVGPLAVVGRVAADAAVANLSAYVLVRDDGESVPITEIVLLADRSQDVEELVATLPILIASDGPLTVQRGAMLVSLRDELAREAGALDAAILIGSLAVSGLLVGTILYGAMEQRRREFGLRRSQGATRTTIVNLVMIESAALFVVAAAFGVVIGSAAVLIQTGEIPDVLLSISVAALIILTGMVAAALPAILAALREPLYVLRSD